MDNKIDEKKIKALIHSIGLKYNLSDHIIKEIVESPYEFTSIIMKELDLDDIKTEEDLSKIKTNFIYKAFAKLYINFPLINRRNKQKENIINLNNSKKWKK
mgnify:CR=1 FL=1